MYIYCHIGCKTRYVLNINLLASIKNRKIFNINAEFPYIFQFTFQFHLGAAIANHVKVTDLVKNDEGRIVGAKMRDQLTGDTWITKAKSVVNATGPFTGV